MYIATISSRDAFEPKINAKRPKAMIRPFLYVLQSVKPNLSEKITLSIILGKTKPNNEKQNAPMRPIKGLIAGTAAANPTANITNTVRRI